MILNRTQELDHSITLTLRCLVEVHGCTVGMTLLAVAVPHDGFHLVAGTAVSPQWYVIRYDNVPPKDVGRTLSPEEITVVQADFDRLIQGGDGA